MKKLFTILMCSLLYVAVAHGEVTHSLSGTVLTISGTGAMQDYTSASQTPWKSSLSTITELIVEEGVTRIGASAFDGATKLTKITFPSSLQSIGDYAFYNCKAMSEIHAYSPNHWASVTIGDSYPTYSHPFAQSSATNRKFFFFGNTASNTTLAFTAGLKEIKAYTFYKATGISDLCIPGTVETIGQRAFDCAIANSLTINRKTPPTTGSNAFKFNSGKTTYLYVPAGASNSYKNTPWYDYSGTNGAKKIGYSDHSSTYVSELGGKTFKTSGTITSTSIAWTLSEDGVLTLNGSGAIPQLSSSNTNEKVIPWYRFRRLVNKVVVKGGVTDLNNAIRWCFAVEDIALEQATIPTATLIGTNGTTASFTDIFNKRDGVILSISLANLSNTSVTKLASSPWNDALAHIALSEPVAFSEEASAEDLDMLDLISTYIEEPFTLELSRTLSNAYANTFCAPVDMNADLIAATFGAGTKVYSLTTSTFNQSANTLQLDFAEQTSIEAGKPYVIQPANTTANPAIEGVEPASLVTDAGSVAASDVTFYGTLTPRDVTEGEIANSSFIFLQANNTLAWAESGTLKGMRAYFILNDNVAENIKKARPIMRLGQTATAITIVGAEPQANEAQKIMQNGQLLIIRNGKTYNAMGMIVE